MCTGTTAATVLGNIAHDAYAASTNGGQHINWSVLSDKQRAEWMSAAAAVRDAVVGMPLGLDPTPEPSITNMLENGGTFSIDGQVAHDAALLMEDMRQKIAEIHEFITQLKPLLDRIPTSMAGMLFPGRQR